MDFQLLNSGSQLNKTNFEFYSENKCILNHPEKWLYLQEETIKPIQSYGIWPAKYVFCMCIEKLAHI